VSGERYIRTKIVRLTAGWSPERDAVVRAATSQIQLSGPIREPAFPSRPGSAQAAERNVGDGRSRATRSHAQSALAREQARMASTGPSPQ
jgi:hypothetical protein